MQEEQGVQTLCANHTHPCTPPPGSWHEDAQLWVPSGALQHRLTPGLQRQELTQNPLLQQISGTELAGDPRAFPVTNPATAQEHHWDLQGWVGKGRHHGTDKIFLL